MGKLDKGFTLVELLITIAILAILATLAVPSMQQFINDYRMKNAAVNIATVLATARSQALNHHSVRVNIDSTYKNWQATYSDSTTGQTTGVAEVDISSDLSITGGVVQANLPASAGNILRFAKTGRTNLTSTIDIAVCKTGSNVMEYLVTVYKSGSVEVNRGANKC